MGMGMGMGMGHYSVSSNAIVLFAPDFVCVGYSVLWELSVCTPYILASWLLLFAPPGIIFHMEFNERKGEDPGVPPPWRIN